MGLMAPVRLWVWALPLAWALPWVWALALEMASSVVRLALGFAALDLAPLKNLA
tara:strand:+ start:1753 stop:1914 length:162 start_codon:yes stop_codon:yes gene_type:complete